MISAPDHHRQPMAAGARAHPRSPPHFGDSPASQERSDKNRAENVKLGEITALRHAP